MASIRVAIAGLSASATTTWASDAHLPYLLSARGQQHYYITALLNSSATAAQAAIKHFNLPATTKAYGKDQVEDLAKDNNVDIVVVCTRVDTHADIARPVLTAGKPVFVEWPIASTYADSVELIKSNGITDTGIAALQGRFSPIVLKLKEILQSGRIGKVLSSSFSGYSSLLERDKLPEGLGYFADRKVGGNMLTIAYAHTIDYVHEVLGDWTLLSPERDGNTKADFQTHMAVSRPKISIIDPHSKSTVKETQSDVPDFLSIQGTVSSGAILTGTFRNGKPFKGTPAFVWSINGELGEILVTSPSGPYIFSGDSYGERPQIQIHDFATDEVKELEWDWAEWQKDLPIRSRGIAQVYERYARWVDAGKPKDRGEDMDFPSLESGVDRMKEIQRMFEQFDARAQ
jgi:predicted dehydrogenase